eukprot:599628-Rhodomonas_salina.1
MCACVCTEDRERQAAVSTVRHRSPPGAGMRAHSFRNLSVAHSQVAFSVRVPGSSSGSRSTMVAEKKPLSSEDLHRERQTVNSLEKAKMEWGAQLKG